MAMTMTTKRTTANMVRNQNMVLQSRYWSRRPPMIGPKVGPNVTLIDAYSMYLPHCARVDISVATALPIEMALLLLEL
jgi:hypothetical protein